MHSCVFNDLTNSSHQTSNYLKSITPSGPTHMMSMADLVAINVHILKIDSECSREKGLTELIYINP